MASYDVLAVTSVEQAIAPADVKNATTNGAWVSLQDYGRLVVEINGNAGGAGEDVTISLEEAKDSSGTSAQALSITRAYAKSGTGLTGAWKAMTITSGSVTKVGDEKAVIRIDVLDSDLSDGYSHVRVKLVQSGGATAQLVGATYLLTAPTFAGSPDTLATAV